MSLNRGATSVLLTSLFAAVAWQDRLNDVICDTRSLGGRRNWNFQENFRPLRTAQVALFRRRKGVRLPQKRLTFADFSSATQTPRLFPQIVVNSKQFVTFSMLVINS